MDGKLPARESPWKNIVFLEGLLIILWRKNWRPTLLGYNMFFSKRSFEAPTLEGAYVLLIVISLLFLSDDGVVYYGSIPTYLLLLGFIYKAIRSPRYLLLARYEFPFLSFYSCLVLSLSFSTETSRISHIQSYLLMGLTYVYARSAGSDKNIPIYLFWLFSMYLAIDFSLMALQLVTGNPAYFVGELDYLLPVGVHADQHKNAFTILICYSFIQSNLIGSKLGLASALLSIICFMFLVVASSRAGLLVFALITTYMHFVYSGVVRFSVYMATIALGVAYLHYAIGWGDGADRIYDAMLPAFEVGYASARMKYSAFFTDGSGAERLALWGSFPDLDPSYWLRLCLFGIGPGSIDTLNKQTMHNTALDIFASVGLFGLISIGILILRVLKSANHGINNQYGSALKSVVISIMMFSMMHDFGRGRYLWFFLGLLSGLYFKIYKTSTKS